MEQNAKQSPTLILKRVVNAKRSKVFDAWTKPELMSQWFYPGIGKALVKNELRTGGSFENKMVIQAKPGQSSDCGTSCETNTYTHTGKYLEIVPPEKLVFTWSSHLVTDSKVTVTLRELGDATEVTLTHELLETEDLRQKHNGGWDGCLTNLANYLG